MTGTQPGRGLAPGSVEAALAAAEPVPWWHQAHALGSVSEPLAGGGRADVVVVGAGFTGLWTAIELKRRHPSVDVVLVDSSHVGHGASGRNGGFLSDSLTHGLEHGLSRWPGKLEHLLRLGRENLDDLVDDVRREAIDADLRLVGKTVVATAGHQVEKLQHAHRTLLAHGERSQWLTRDEVRADVDSPTYLAGLRIRSGGGLVDPVGLAVGLRDWALRLGVRLHEETPVLALDGERSGTRVRTPYGSVLARQVALATNAYRPLRRSLRPFLLPIFDYVLVTEPLAPAQWEAIGWSERQGLTDAGNQFHYYRPTADGRILWGGYDAVYHYGSNTSAALEQRDASHELLARQFFQTFPQLAGAVRFTHRWGGLIDTTSRFTAYVDVDRHRRMGHAFGFTGLGVGASRFAARTLVDLLGDEDTERTRLGMLTGRPVPFPPEPVRYGLVGATRAALAREDRTGRRGAWLRLLDRFGVGFDS